MGCENFADELEIHEKQPMLGKRTPAVVKSWAVVYSVYSSPVLESVWQLLLYATRSSGSQLGSGCQQCQLPDAAEKLLEISTSPKSYAIAAIGCKHMQTIPCLPKDCRFGSGWLSRRAYRNPD